MNELQDKKALITGGSNGIGQAIAIAFAKAGADIVFTYHQSLSGANETLTQIHACGRRGHGVQASLEEDTTLENLVVQAIQFLGGVDVLVNNAGTVSRYSFLDIPSHELDRIMAVNLKAPFFLTQRIASHMQQQKKPGSIINISSISAEVCTPGLAHYECSKAAMNMLTKSSAIALAKYNIRVNGIAPGLVATQMNHTQRETDPEAWHMRKSYIPLARAGEPSDIVSMALLLASDQSNWMTGSIISVDGGSSISCPNLSKF